MAGVIFSLTEKSGDVLIIYRVVNDVAGPSRFNHTPVFENAKLVGCSRFRDAGENREVANAE